MNSSENNKDTDTVRYLKFITFALGDERFAIPMDDIKEIIAAYEIVPLPKAPEFIEGIISLRGEIIPVVEMRKRFDMSSRARDEDTRVVILEMSNFIVGIEVDSVYEVLKLPESAIDPPPRLVAGLKSDYLDGVAEVDGKLTIMLNLEEIFSTTEKIVMKEGFGPGDSGNIEAERPLSPSAKVRGEVDTKKVSAAGQLSFRGKSYYIGKKYKGKEVALGEDGGRLTVILDGEKIKEFEV